jgi:hypothetical protein
MVTQTKRQKAAKRAKEIEKQTHETIKELEKIQADLKALVEFLEEEQ